MWFRSIEYKFLYLFEWVLGRFYNRGNFWLILEGGDSIGRSYEFKVERVVYVKFI